MKCLDFQSNQHKKLVPVLSRFCNWLLVWVKKNIRKRLGRVSYIQYGGEEFFTRIFPLKTLDYPYFERFPVSRASLTYRLHFEKKKLRNIEGKWSTTEPQERSFFFQTMELPYARYVIAHHCWKLFCLKLGQPLITFYHFIHKSSNLKHYYILLRYKIWWY